MERLLSHCPGFLVMRVETKWHMRKLNQVKEKVRDNSSFIQSHQIVRSQRDDCSLTKKHPVTAIKAAWNSWIWETRTNSTSHLHNLSMPLEALSSRDQSKRSLPNLQVWGTAQIRSVYNLHCDRRYSLSRDVSNTASLTSITVRMAKNWQKVRSKVS